MSDYYLLAPKIKMIKGKESSRVITGPVQMYIENVPTPLVLPFAILPFSEKEVPESRSPALVRGKMLVSS